jgi:Rhomboid-like protein
VSAVPRQAVGTVFRRYAVAWLYLAAFCAVEISYRLLPTVDQVGLVRWASTSVHNLQHHPVGCLVVSAFVPSGSELAWPFLIVLALFGANHLLGNWRTLVTCVTAHVVGTLASEGIVAHRIAAGTLPAADRYLVDVGPSYVVVAAIAVGLLWGNWLIRSAAAVDFALLIFVGQIFQGLSHLELSAVGHLTALIARASAGSLLRWQRLRRQWQSKARALSGHV